MTFYACSCYSSMITWGMQYFLGFVILGAWYCMLCDRILFNKKPVPSYSLVYLPAHFHTSTFTQLQYRFLVLTLKSKKWIPRKIYGFCWCHLINVYFLILCSGSFVELRLFNELRIKTMMQPSKFCANKVGGEGGEDGV